MADDAQVDKVAEIQHKQFGLLRGLVVKPKLTLSSILTCGVSIMKSPSVDNNTSKLVLVVALDDDVTTDDLANDLDAIGRDEKVDHADYL